MHDDLRYAIRALRHSPGFTITATLTLALGIGANTAIFGLINGFGRPLPVPTADRLVVLATRVAGDDSGLRYRFSFPALEDFRRQGTVFSEVFGFDLRIGGLGVNGTTSPFVYQAVTGNFFSGLDLRPAAGRFLRAGEGEHAGAPIAIVLGHAYFRKRFGGDSSVVGSSVRLDGQFATVIGVAPEGFHGLFNGIESDGYPSLSAVSATVRDGGELFADRSDRFLTAVARLKPGVSLSSAQDAANLIASRLEIAYPGTDSRTAVRVMPETLARPMPLPFFERFLPAIKLLMLVLAALVPAIACMNVTNLLLVRATARQHEMAIRAALGSAPSRLIRLVLSEASVLAVLGMTTGLLIGRWVLAVLIAALDIDAVSQTTGLTINLAAADFDGPVYAYAAGMAIASAALVAMVPAWRASGANVHALLHQGGRTHAGGGGRFRALLVVAQVAGSLVLLIVSGLLVRNLLQAQHVDLGFDPSHVVAARIDPRHVGYDQARTRTFFEELERRLLAIPGAESAAQSFSIPLSYVVGEGAPIAREGEIVRPDEPQPVIGYNSVTPGYFDTLRLAILRGRGFTIADAAASTRVAIVNEMLAARLWPGEDPIGRRFSMPENNGALRQVVGVVRDSKHIAVFEGSLPHFYLPLVSEKLATRAILVRSAMPPDALSAAVRTQVAALDPEMPVSDIAPMERTIAGNIGFLLFRVGALEAAALGVLGLILAVVGVYGVVSYGASQQTRSIGIRMALGADAGDVRRLVLGQGARLVTAGVAFGLIGTIGFTRAIHGMLVVVDTSDPVTFLIVTLALVAVGLTACYLPAHRATRVDPVVVLRSE